MAQPNSAAFTVTGKNGPGLTVTSRLFTNVQSFTVDVVKGMLTMNQNGADVQVAINTATTFTVVITAGNYTVTIS